MKAGEGKMSDPIDLDALEAAARAATQGEWKSDVDCFSEGENIQATVSDEKIDMLFIGDTGVTPVSQQAWSDARQSQASKDAAYIAILNPAVALRLIALARAGQAAIDAAVLAEREACALLAEYSSGTNESIAGAIRARSNPSSPAPQPPS
jgi:hypothetical protein